MWSFPSKTAVIALGPHMIETTSALESYAGRSEVICSWRRQIRRFSIVLWGASLLTGLVFSCERAVGQPSATAVGPVAANEACPATDFRTFLPLFSASPDLQRRYTRFPLKFGLWDPGHMEGPDDGYKTSMITSFEKIPNYSPESRTVLPTPTYMQEHGLKTSIITVKNSKKPNDENAFPEEIVRDAAHVIVRVGVPDTGVNVLYLFRRMNGCWFLYSISDRST